jgi:hypothetical protein
MQYREELKNRIRELEFEISNKRDHREILQKELQDLMRKEFEEDMREDNDRQTLLKG